MSSSRTASSSTPSRVRSTGLASAALLHFTAGGSGITATVVTQGASGLDFADAGTGTCDTNGTGHTYSAGDTCSVNVTLTPKYAGPRYGAVQLLNGSRSVIATATHLRHRPGAADPVPEQSDYHASGRRLQLSLGRGRGRCSGNVYVADYGPTARCKEMPAGCVTSSCVTTLGGGFSYPYGVAVDGAGNIYVADYLRQQVKEMPPGCASSSCVTTLGGGFSQPYRRCGGRERQRLCRLIRTTSAVKEMPPGCAPPVASRRWAAASAHLGAWRWTAAATSTSRLRQQRGEGDAPRLRFLQLRDDAGRRIQPALMAWRWTASGNVYVADSATPVKEMPAGCPSASCVTTLGSGFDVPTGVAAGLRAATSMSPIAVTTR